jgi:hypothetical protein
MENKDKIISNDNDDIIHNHVFIPLKEYLDMSIGIDLEYQSNERWNLKQQQHYIESLLTNSAPDPFKFVNVNKCLKNAKKLKQNETGSRTRSYYTKWNDKKIDFLNVDGNNRYITIKNFFNNELEMPPIKFPYPSKSNNKVFKKTEWSFGDLTQETQDDIKNNINVSINMYTQITIEQMKDLFIRSNSGLPLNRQEKRNAIDSYAVELLRKRTNEFLQLWLGKDVYKKKAEINRRKPDGMIARLMYNHIKGIEDAVNDDDLDNAFKSGAVLDLKKNRDKSEKFLTGFFDFIKKNEKILKLLKGKNRRFYINLIFDIANEYAEKWKNYKPDTQRNHLRKFVSIYNDLINDTRNAYIEIGNKGKLHTFRNILRSAETNRVNKRLELYRNKLKSRK